VHASAEKEITCGRIVGIVYYGSRIYYIRRRAPLRCVTAFSPISPSFCCVRDPYQATPAVRAIDARTFAYAPRFALARTHVRAAHHSFPPFLFDSHSCFYVQHAATYLSCD